MAANALAPLVSGGALLGINRPTYTSSCTLAANTAESITVPAGAKKVFLNGTVDFYANFITTATIPGDVTDGTASLLLNTPMFISLEGAATISVISAYVCNVSASFYK
jgi:hypothetical protein